jgi:PhnB protein
METTMSVKSTAHINFRGDARDALEFYKSVFGGHMTVVTFADAHNVSELSEANQVMWGEVVAPNGFHVMAYDVPSKLGWHQGENAFFFSIRGETAQEISELWDRLSVGSTIKAPLAPSGWTPAYGMLQDRFGVTWVLDVAVAYAAA